MRKLSMWALTAIILIYAIWQMVLGETAQAQGDCVIGVIIAVMALIVTFKEQK